MEQSDLRGLLMQLHARLASGVALSAEDKLLLGSVLGDIEKALTAQASAEVPDTSALESLAVKFEAEHPALAGTLRRVVDSLGKAGI